MPWKRLGLVFVPDGRKPWARSHATLPTPAQTGPDVFRFFFSSRDEANRSHVGWIDVDLSGSPFILQESSEAVLAPGEDGTFDDSGIGVGCLTQANDALRLYYMGWNLGVRAPWHNAIGFAQARTPLDLFKRYSPGPILDRSPEDPYTLTYPWVLRLGDHDWWMWYGSNLIADLSSTGMRHAIKVARSRDGICWQREGATVVNSASADEHVIVRPSVVRLGEIFLMAFACRGARYCVGIAWSADGVNWIRIDEFMGLKPANEGWDSQMVCYPALFWHRNQLWLAYNGNGYGASGIGLAKWEGDYPVTGRG